jgi:8-oxo-dGTP diphosphatase
MMIIKVVCGIIWQGDKVFIAKKMEGKFMAGHWEFPGGKIEHEEDAEHALVRELREELGMEIKFGKLLGKHLHQYDTFTIQLMAYHCDFVTATFKLTDHDEYCFVRPSKLKDYKISPADMFFVDLITN